MVGKVIARTKVQVSVPVLILRMNREEIAIPVISNTSGPVEKTIGRSNRPFSSITPGAANREELCTVRDYAKLRRH